MSTLKDVAPSLNTMVQNILVLFRAADEVAIFEGTHWYDQARLFATDLASRYGTTVDVAASVIAAHSMNASWKANMTRAENHLAGTPSGLTAAITMGDNAIDAWLFEKGSPLDMVVGPKVNPFARAVAGDLNAVATDRWAQRAAFDTLDDGKANRWIGRKGVRQNMIDAYTKAAAEAGVPPAVMQAIVWVVVRGAAD